MKDLMTVKTGITHSGKFHTDDVVSTAFIKSFNPNINVIRVKEFNGEGDTDVIVYDVGLGEFDHHQEERKIDLFGHAYCAFGLLWEAYGKEYLKRRNFTHLEEAFDLFNRKFVSKINQGDNEGYKKVKRFFENDLIVKCNPMWFEEITSELKNMQFEKAVRLAQAFLDTWTRQIFHEVEDHTYCIE